MGDTSRFFGIFFLFAILLVVFPSQLHPRSLCLRHTVTFMAFGLCMEVDKLVQGSWEHSVR